MTDPNKENPRAYWVFKFRMCFKENMYKTFPNIEFIKSVFEKLNEFSPHNLNFYLNKIVKILLNT